MSTELQGAVAISQYDERSPKSFSVHTADGLSLVALSVLVKSNSGVIIYRAVGDTVPQAFA